MCWDQPVSMAAAVSVVAAYAAAPAVKAKCVALAVGSDE